MAWKGLHSFDQCHFYFWCYIRRVCLLSSLLPTPFSSIAHDLEYSLTTPFSLPRTRHLRPIWIVFLTIRGYLDPFSVFRIWSFDDLVRDCLESKPWTDILEGNVPPHLPVSYLPGETETHRTQNNTTYSCKLLWIKGLQTCRAPIRGLKIFNNWLYGTVTKYW